VFRYTVRGAARHEDPGKARGRKVSQWRLERGGNRQRPEQPRARDPGRWARRRWHAQGTGAGTALLIGTAAGLGIAAVATRDPGAPAVTVAPTRLTSASGTQVGRVGGLRVLASRRSAGA
jgi:hypothetical protein